MPVEAPSDVAGRDPSAIGEHGPVRAAARPAPSVRGVVTTGAVGKVVELATLVALATVVPRAMGASDFGRYSVALTLVTVGSLALTLGGPPLITRFVPAAAPSERVGMARLLGLRLARSRATLLAALVVVAVLLASLFPDAVPPGATAIVVAALIASVATTVLLLMPLGLGRVGPWSARYPVQNVVLIVATLWLYPSAGVSGAVSAILVATVVTLAFASVASWPILVAGDRPAPPLPRGAVRFGVMHGAGAALVQVTHRGGVLAVALLAGSPSATGDVALATGIALGATYAVLQLFTVSLPRVAGIEDLDAAEGVLRRLAWWVLVGLAPGCVAVAATLDRLVPALFGSGFDGAIAAFGPALAIVVLAPLSALVVQVASLRMRPEVALVSGVAAFAAFVLVALVAVPALGAAGGTGAVLAGVTVSAVASLRMLPGAVDRGLGLVSFGGAAIVLTVAILA